MAITTFETLMNEAVAGTLTLSQLNIRSVSMNDVQRLTLVTALATGDASLDIDVFMMAGQSNMQGNPTVSGTSPTPIVGTAFQYYSGTISACVDPVGNATNGSCSPSFAVQYNALTGRKVCVVPVAIGGSAQVAAAASGGAWTHWDATGNLRSTASTTYEAAITALTAAGYTPRRAGVVWHQGERDAIKIVDQTITSAQYSTALTTMIAAFRTAHGATLPFYIATTPRRTPKYLGEDLVIQPQHDVADADDYTKVVWSRGGSFEGLGLIDTGHYTQEGYNIMGRMIAQGIVRGEDVDAKGFTSTLLPEGNISAIPGTPYSNGKRFWQKRWGHVAEGWEEVNQPQLPSEGLINLWRAGDLTFSTPYNTAVDSETVQRVRPLEGTTDLEQTISGERPTFTDNVMGDKPAFVYDGSSDHQVISEAILNGASEATLVLIGRGGSTIDGRPYGRSDGTTGSFFPVCATAGVSFLASTNTGTNLIIPATGATDLSDTNFLIIITLKSGASECFVNGASEGVNSDAWATLAVGSPLMLGALSDSANDDTSHYDGSIAVVGVYDRVLTTPEIKELEDHAARYYGVTMN